MDLIGRLHPLVVHLPIGILLLAFLFEILSRFSGFKKLRGAVNTIVFIGAISAIAACLSGWMLSQEPGYEEKLLEQHKISGLVTAALSLMLLTIFYWIKVFNKDSRKKIRLLAFLPLVVLILITGHLGGSLTHGEGFLLAPSEDQGRQSTIARVIPPEDVDKAIIYNDLVKPVLESKCYSCHSSKKQKGKLRLDGEEWIIKGGKNGEIMNQGNPGESEMFKRISLPIDNKNHMPPREKAQPTSGEIDLISQWISEGASFNMTVAQSKGALFFKKHIAVSSSTKNLNWWPQESVGEPEEQSVMLLRKADVVLEFLAEESNYLSLSFLTYDSFPSNTWQSILKLNSQIVSVRLSGNYISPTDWQKLSELKNIRMLYLDNTSVTDQDISSLTKFNKLFYLNLAGTKITNQGLSELGSIKSLRKIFLFGTTSSAEGLATLKKQLPDCEIDLGGYSLQSLTTDTLIYRSK